MTKYIIHLQTNFPPYKSKRIEIFSKDSLGAMEIVKNKYPDHHISMFWYDWKPVKN